MLAEAGSLVAAPKAGVREVALVVVDWAAEVTLALAKVRVGMQGA